MSGPLSSTELGIRDDHERMDVRSIRTPICNEGLSLAAELQNERSDRQVPGKTASDLEQQEWRPAELSGSRQGQSCCGESVASRWRLIMAGR